MLKHILLIDNDESVIESLSNVLKKNGYEVSVALNGQEGIVVFDKKKIDLVITEILMPEKDGIEVIIEIRQKKRSKIPIIATSDEVFKFNIPNSILNYAKAFGADYTLKKPFSNTELLSIVQYLLPQN